MFHGDQLIIFILCILATQKFVEGGVIRQRRDVPMTTIIRIDNCDPSNVTILNGKDADVVASASEDNNQIVRNGISSVGPRSLYEIIRTVLHSAKNSVPTRTREFKKLRLGRKLLPPRPYLNNKT